MYVAYLAGNAGRVVLPEAVQVISSGSDAEVSFVDAQGRVMACFQREDLAIYSRDSDPVGDLMAREGSVTKRGRDLG
jgi:hypothetical protein